MEQLNLLFTFFSKKKKNSFLKETITPFEYLPCRSTMCGETHKNKFIKNTTQHGELKKITETVTTDMF